MSATPGITSAVFEPSLGAKLNNETDRQEEVHTLKTAKGQPRANPETGSAESTQDDQEPLAKIPAFRVHPQANLKLPLHPERRAHKHRGQDAETGCIINNSRGGADHGNRF